MPENTKFVVVWGLMMFLILFSDCSQPKSDNHSLQDSTGTDSLEVQVVPIKEVSLETEEIMESFLYANRDAFIVAKKGGMVKEVCVDLGDQVSKGDTLAKIEDELLLLEFKLAQNYSAQVRQDFERNKILFDKRLISKSDYEKIKLKCEQAEIERELALERLRYSRLIAPFSGIIVSNWARIGKVVGAGDSLFHLVEKFPIYTRVFLSEEQLTRLKTEGKAKIESKYGVKESAWGTIIKKSPTVDPVTGTVELIIRIDPKCTFCKPGITVNVFVQTHTPTITLAVPKTAFSNSLGLSSEDRVLIYLYKDGRTVKKIAQLGEDLDSLWEIKGGFKAGDSVIVYNPKVVKEGQKIKLNHTATIGGK